MFALMFALILINITIYVCIFQDPHTFLAPSYPELISMKPLQKAPQKADRQGKAYKVLGTLGRRGTYPGTLRSQFTASTESRPHYRVTLPLEKTDVPLAKDTVSLDPVTLETATVSLDPHMIVDTGTVSHEIEVTTPDSTLGDSTLEELLALGKTPDNSGTQDLSATSQTSQTTLDIIETGLDLESDLQSKNIEK